MKENPVNLVNPVKNPDPALSDNSELEIHNSELAPPALRSTRSLSRLACLSESQLQQINSWLDDAVPYREIVERCRTRFQAEIPHMTLWRYNKRSAARTLIDDFNDSKEAAAEISKYAATGDASFSTNTLELLEQQAFDLALAYHRDADAEDLQTLTKLWNLIHKAKNTRIRERHAAVQEQKVALRRDELTLKRAMSRDHLNPNLNPNLTLSEDDGTEHPLSTPRTYTQSAQALTRTGVRSTTPAPSSASQIHNSEFKIHNSSSAPASAATSASLSQQGQQGRGLGEGFSALPNQTHHLPLKTYHSLFPSPLPPEVIEQNILHARKLDCGEIRIISIPGELYQIEYCNPADKHYFETTPSSHKATFVSENRDFYLPGLKSFASKTEPESSNPIDHRTESLETNATNSQPHLES